MKNMSSGSHLMDLSVYESSSLHSSSDSEQHYASQNVSNESSSQEHQIPKGSLQKDRYQHYQKAFEVLNAMRRSGMLCDVILVVDGTEVPAHRAVLAAGSSYFHAMFISKFEESKQDQIEIKEIDASALELLVDYVYTANILITKENVQTILHAANLLQLDVVQDACCDFLKDQLAPTNCYGIRAFADLHSCTNLVSIADTYIEEHFSEVLEGEEFLSLPFSLVERAIKSNKLVVPAEETVFECVMDWVRHDIENRQAYLPLLMEYVRLPMTSREYMLGNVCEEPLLQNNLQCHKYIIEAMKFHVLKPKERASMTNVRTQPRQYNDKSILVVGGAANEERCMVNVQFYNLREQNWYRASDMCSELSCAGLALLDNNVYLIGGIRTCHSPLNDVSLYDIQSDQWRRGVPMKYGRYDLGVAVLNDQIYAVGGYTGSTILGSSSAEMFDPKTQVWRTLAPMSMCRKGVGVGVLNNSLYAVGGFNWNLTQHISTVEYYIPETDMWHACPEMTSKRSGVGVCTMDGILYAIGGSDGSGALNTCEAFDPNSGIWKRIAKMAFAREYASVVSHNGLIYVLGGGIGSLRLASVEVYCAKNDTWMTCPQLMDVGRCCAAVALINKPPPPNL